MTLAEIIQQVYYLTNRPDLVNETATAVSAATLRAHHTDYYFKDLVESYWAFPNLDYAQTLPYSALNPYFRALKYLRKFYPCTGPNNPPIQDQSPSNLPPLYGMYYDPGVNLPDGRFFKIITPDNVLDSYFINKIDIAYIAGQNIVIRSGDQFQYMLTGIYTHPNITPANYNSWIANEFPFAIIYAAAAIVFKTIGYDEQNQQYQNLMQEEIGMLQMSNVQAEGY